MATAEDMADLAARLQAFEAQMVAQTAARLLDLQDVKAGQAFTPPACLCSGTLVGLSPDEAVDGSFLKWLHVALDPLFGEQPGHLSTTLALMAHPPLHCILFFRRHVHHHVENWRMRYVR